MSPAGDFVSKIFSMCLSQGPHRALSVPEPRWDFRPRDHLLCLTLYQIPGYAPDLDLTVNVQIRACMARVSDDQQYSEN